MELETAIERVDNLQQRLAGHAYCSKNFPGGCDLCKDEEYGGDDFDIVAKLDAYLETLPTDPQRTG